ncbi:MAG: alpha/beta fold hydrolase [Rudaea sp.]
MRELTLDLPQGRFAALAWGDPAKPPLLALHGWLDNAASFAALAPLLCAHFQVVAIDMLGHGRSVHAAPGNAYHFADGVLEALDAADALGWRAFDLLGHSRGGGIAVLTAAACPERIHRLVLIEAMGPIATPAEQSAAQLQRAARQIRDTARKPLRVFATSEEAVEARANASSLSTEGARQIVLRGIRAVPGGYSWSSDARLTIASLQRFTEAQVLDIVGAIKAPTLLLVAPDSAVKPVAEAAFAARIARVADIDVCRIPGGHHLHLENPGPVAEAMLAFLQNRRSPAACGGEGSPT